MNIDNLLQPLLSQLNAGVLVVDSQLRIVYFNHFIASRISQDLAAVQGKNLFNVFTDLPQAWLSRKLDTVFSLQVPVFSSWEQRQYVLKLPHLRKQHISTPYMAQNCTMLPLQDPQSRQQYACLLLEDATDAYIYQRQLQQRDAQLEQINRLDSLTGIVNRRSWELQLNHELQRAERYKHSLSLILFDIDRFRALNERFGHQGGDAVLVSLTGLISTLLRDTDCFGRYGGGEFGIILPATDAAGAKQLAERICQAVSAHTIKCNQQLIRTSLSLGAVQALTTATADELLQQADLALYTAKRQGRNQAVLYQSSLQDVLKKVNFQPD